MHQNAQNTIGNNLMFSELPERVVKMHQSAFIKDPIFSKHHLKRKQKWIKVPSEMILSLSYESPEGIMKNHQNLIRFPLYDESPTQYFFSNSNESFESDDPLDKTYLPDPIAITSDKKLFRNIVSQNIR